MKRMLLLVTLLLAVATTATAKGSSHVYSQSTSAGIVEPDVATGMRKWSAWNNDTAGNMVVCMPDNYTWRNSFCTKWMLASSTIPIGKTYVGFRVVYQGSNSNYLEVYWK